MSTPATLGKYRITEVLGEGAMGVVYKAFDPDIQRVVALKTIRRELDDGSEFGASIAARFRNEAQAAGRLTHPGIVAVYDYGEDGKVAFIAMEFVEGSTLAHTLKSGAVLSDHDIVALVGQLLDALGHAHAMGVWHRDVKPANLIMTPQGRLKVSDFGIARIENLGLTRTASMIGTPSHMAPEQFTGSAIDQRVDLYGAGVVLYQLVTGRLPFTGTAESMMYQVVHAPPVLPSQLAGAGLGPRFDAVIATALAKQPAQRFASAAAFKAALVAALSRPAAGEGPDVDPDQTIVVPAGRPRPAAQPPIAGSTALGALPAHWDATVLAQAEQALARHLGPMATVLVRRTARDCQDPAELMTRLAAHVDDAVARQAFLGQALPPSASGAGPQGAVVAGRSTAAGKGAGAAAATDAGAPGLDAALLDAATRLLAQQVGPIAKVLVRKAAARTPQRAAFFALLAESVDDPAARQALLASLSRLP